MVPTPIVTMACMTIFYAAKSAFYYPNLTTTGSRLSIWPRIHVATCTYLHAQNLITTYGPGLPEMGCI